MNPSSTPLPFHYLIASLASDNPNGHIHRITKRKEKKKLGRCKKNREKKPLV
jgi:hypothetical protein